MNCAPCHTATIRRFGRDGAFVSAPARTMQGKTLDRIERVAVAQFVTDGFQAVPVCVHHVQMFANFDGHMEAP